MRHQISVMVNDQIKINMLNIFSLQTSMMIYIIYLHIDFYKRKLCLWMHIIILMLKERSKYNLIYIVCSDFIKPKLLMLISL